MNTCVSTAKLVIFCAILDSSVVLILQSFRESVIFSVHVESKLS